MHVFEQYILLCYCLLGLFYYTLGNLEPHLRSPTNGIQLVSVVKTSLIGKYGIDTILEPFVQAIVKLESVSHLDNTLFHTYMQVSCVSI